MVSHVQSNGQTEKAIYYKSHGRLIDRTFCPHSTLTMSLRLAIKVTQEKAGGHTLPKMLAISFLACTLSTRARTSNEFRAYSECLHLRAYFSIQTTTRWSFDQKSTQKCPQPYLRVYYTHSRTNVRTAPVAVPTPVLRRTIYARTFRMLRPDP